MPDERDGSTISKPPRPGPPPPGQPPPTQPTPAIDTAKPKGQPRGPLKHNPRRDGPSEEDVKRYQERHGRP